MLSIGERYTDVGGVTGGGNETGLMGAKFWTKFYEDVRDGSPNDEILSYEYIAAFAEKYLEQWV